MGSASSAQEESAIKRAARTATKFLFYTGLAVLVGLLADWLQGPPPAVTMIIVATLFATLIGNDVTRR